MAQITSYHQLACAPKFNRKEFNHRLTYLLPSTFFSPVSVGENSHRAIASEKTLKKQGRVVIRANTSKASGEIKPQKLNMSLSEVVFHLSAIASTAAIAKTFFNGSRFGYHPTFLALGFVFLMGEGIVFAIKAKGKERQGKLRLHTLFQVFAAVAISGGMYAIYTNKIINGKPHFTTIHGKIGLLALILNSVVAFGGIPALYGLPKFLKKLTARVNTGHKLFGTFSFLLALASVELGLQISNPNHPLHKGILTYAIGTTVVVAAISLLWRSFAILQLEKNLKKIQKNLSPGKSE